MPSGRPFFAIRVPIKKPVQIWLELLCSHPSVNRLPARFLVLEVMLSEWGVIVEEMLSMYQSLFFFSPLGSSTPGRQKNPSRHAPFAPPPNFLGWWLGLVCDSSLFQDSDHPLVCVQPSSGVFDQESNSIKQAVTWMRSSYVSSGHSFELIHTAVAVAVAVGSFARRKMGIFELQNKHASSFYL